MFKYKWQEKQYRVEFFHSSTASLPCVPWHQQTTCLIIEESPNPDEFDLATGHGVALCSKKDQFSKAKGREIAFQRALAALTADKSERRVWWLAFWNSEDGRKTKGSQAFRKMLGLDRLNRESQASA